MPPKKKITRENILDVAINIINDDGFGALNARRIAKELNCSVQPIYSAFENMLALKNELIKQTAKEYNNYIEESKKSENAYLASGMAYVRFAHEKGNLFRLLFMSKRDASTNYNADPTLDYIYSIVQKKTGFTLDQAKRFHFEMTIFAQGIATFVLNNFITYDIDSIRQLFGDEYWALYGRFKHENESN